MLLLLLFLCNIAHSQVIPSAFYYSSSESRSVNGSSITGHCSGAIDGVDMIRCLQPTTSVLFDGNIPTRIGGDGWASQLLTLQASGYSTEVIFDFSATPGYVGIERIEVVLFNCPLWGISTDHFRIIAEGFAGRQYHDISYVSVTACDTLVKVCRSLSTNSSVLILRMPVNHNDWAYLAEVRFYNGNSDQTCQALTIINDQSLITPPSFHPSLPTTKTATSTTTSDTISSASCSTFTGLAYYITVLVTVLVLSAVIFVLVQSAVCRCRRTSKSDSGAASGIREEEQGVRYAPSHSPNYMEVGVTRGRSAFPLKENEAYATPQ